MSESADSNGFSVSELEAQMLGALELLHYSHRFGDHRFIIAFEKFASFDALLLDLRVLAVSHIQPTLFFPSHPELEQFIESLIKRGAPFVFLGESTNWNDALELSSSGKIPVYSLPNDLCEDDRDQQIAAAANALAASKVFLLCQSNGLKCAGKLVSHPSPTEVEELCSLNEDIGFPKERLMKLHQIRQSHGFEMILLEDSPGSLFQEIFTHRGKGTLLADDYANTIRTATAADAHQVSLLMRPYRHDRSILPITEGNILAEVENYLVYTINEQVVASARLKDYGEVAELAKFSTLPRYQGRGRARELAKRLIENARQAKKKAVFALSVEPKMWVFFERLGFVEIDRAELPQDWKKDYDFTRESKAFWLNLD